MKLARPPIPLKKGSPSESVAEGGGWGEKFRHARAEAKRFRHLGIKTLKQKTFQNREIKL
ncbi:MAG: hypothetical protein PHR36_01265 [Patescibacteria group bacterium]|nr:hypothetical protein [Patescibacteria group bacterium]